jgi:D-cysteine desulfhydrase
MTHPTPLAAFDNVPTIGWVTAPSPVQRLHIDGCKTSWLGVKRDDLELGLIGGSKVRKLDTLLATEPWKSAPGWTTTGATGSGHLVAVSAAARHLDRQVRAGMFWEPVDKTVLRNLAYTASGPVDLHYSSGRVALFLRHPAWMLGGTVGDRPVIPPGGSIPAGIVGMVRAGLELAVQVREGVLPEPDHVVLPLGSGGSAVGIALGLAMSGLETEVVGVVVVERMLSPNVVIQRLFEGARRHLRRLGIDPGDRRPRLRLERRFVGPAYGVPSAASLSACAQLSPHALALEPVYGGKAMAAILADVDYLRGKNVLFWQTGCTQELAPAADWRDRLPPTLARRLQEAESVGEAPGEGGPRQPATVTRRRVLVAAGALAVVASPIRFGFYDTPPNPGLVLSGMELQILAAAAEAVLSDAQGDERPLPPVDGHAIAARVDRFLHTMPTIAMLEVHGLFALIEHATLVNGRIRRFTRLSVGERRRFLLQLATLGTVPGQAARGIRDLVYLGTYQDPAVWPAIGYGGPLVDRPPPMSLSTEALRASGTTAGSLLAPPGTRPRSMAS